MKKLIGNLKGIYVRSFEFANDGEYSEADVESMRSQLRAPEWSKMVTVRSKNDGDVDVFFKMDKDKIAGLVVIAAEPKELTIVNIVGPIDLDQLSSLGGQFGIPKIDLKGGRNECSRESPSLSRPRCSPASSLCPGSAAPIAAAQTDLDAFMQQVLARRDDNWKKLQQYILDEREQIEVRGPARIPLWGERRDYTWYIRDGFFVRSPVKFNGVTIGEADRRKYEADYLRRVQRRDAAAAGGGRSSATPSHGHRRRRADATSPA